MSFLRHFVLLVILASAFGGPRPLFPKFPPPFLRQGSSQECSLPMLAEKIMDVHKEIMVPLKKIMEDDKKRCLCANVEMPMKLKKIEGKCFVKTMKESKVFEKLVKKASLDKYDFLDDVDKMEQCLLDAHDMTEVNENTIAETFQFKNWFGTDKGKKDLDSITTLCYGKITGETREERMRSFCDCLTSEDLKICTRDDVVPPPTTVLSIVMKSLREESSPCENVVFDISEHYDEYENCLEEIKMDLSETFPGRLMQESNTVKRLVLAAQTFMDANIKAMKCYSEKRNFYDPDTNRYDPVKLSNYITNLPGMEDLPKKKREMLLNAGKRCGTYINQDVDEESGIAFEIKRKCKWDRCMLAAFTKTCGINNDLRYLFFPKLTDEKLRNAMGSLMRQIVGEEGMHDMKMLMMKMGQMMMKMKEEEDM